MVGDPSLNPKFSFQALVALYEEPEKPQDATDYLKNSFAGHGSLVNELAAVRAENGSLKQKMETLEKELGAVKTENRQLKPKLESQVRRMNNWFAIACLCLHASKLAV